MISVLRKLVPAWQAHKESKFSIGSKRQQAFMEVLSNRSAEFRENAESFDVRFKSGMALNFSLKDPVLNASASKDEFYVTRLDMNGASIADINVRKDFRQVCKEAEAARIDLSVTLPREMPPEQQDVYGRFLLTAGFDEFFGATETGLYIRPYQQHLRRA